MPGQIVKVINRGPDFEDMYDSRPYIIPAGATVMIDYDAICLWLGHPEATDFDPRNRVRTAEFQRLRTRYGVDARALEMSLAGQAVDTKELFNAMRPKLECFDMSDKPLITVADDPEGNLINPVQATGLDAEGMMHARMQVLEQELANMRAQLAQQQRTEQALNDAQPITTDHYEGDPEDAPLTAHASGIVGTIQTSEPPADPTVSPRPTPRTTPGEDTPGRVRVSG